MRKDRSRERRRNTLGVTKNWEVERRWATRGWGWGGMESAIPSVASSPQTPTAYSLHSLTVFVPFTSFSKRKGNGCYAGLSSYRNTSESLGEQEMLWEHKLQASVSTAFSVLPNFHKCFYHSKETQRTCFLFLLENTAKKKRKTTC